MNRPIALVLAAVVLAAPAPASAQTSSSDVERARDQAREERDKAREQTREAQEKAREQSRAERDHQRELLDAAGSLDTTVTFDARGTVIVNCPDGDIVVSGGSANEIRVKARTESGAIRFTSTGSRAILEPAAGRRCEDGRYEVTVPAGARVSASSWNGGVTLRAVRGDADVHTQSANVDVRDAGSRLDVETLSGDVTVQGVVSDASIRTVNGDVSLTGARGDVEIETVSGDLTLRDIVARQVRTHTTSGDVSFAGQILGDGRYEFNTHSGDIRLLLPPNVGAQLSISTFNGSIDSDFPITLRAGEHGIGAAQAKRLNFTLGQGNARIVAETFSGEVTLSSTARRR
jgi:DUF4097 and DUF4098 domain-containing protein YvlB